MRAWLGSAEPGLRLLGLTFAQAQGAPQYFEGVLDKIAHSVSAFEQYQALLAMEGLVSVIDGTQKAALGRTLQDQMGPDGYLTDETSRRAIAERILRRLTG